MERSHRASEVKPLPERDRGPARRERDPQRREREARRDARSEPSHAPDSDNRGPRAFGRKHAACIALLALAARFAHFVVASRTGLYDGLFLDGKYYADVAASIRLGHGPGAHPYLMSPLYPYFLALFTDAQGQLNVAWVRAVQAILGAASAVVAAWIAAQVIVAAAPHSTRSSSGGSSTELMHRRARAAAWIAGIVAALYAPLLHLESTVLVSALSGFAITAAVALMIGGDCALENARRRRAGACSAASGIALGLAAALHPANLAIASVFAGCWCARLLRRSRAEVPRTASLWMCIAFMAGVAIPIAPFTLHNVREGGEPVLLSVNGGVNFWIGNGAHATGLFRTPPDYQFATDPVDKGFAEREENRKLGYREASDWWMNRAWSEIRAAPTTWIGLFVKKVGLFFHSTEIPQLGESFTWFRERVWTLRFPMDARVLLLLALCAPLVVIKARGPRAFAGVMWPFLALCAHALVIALFFVTARYRAPIMPIVIALAGVTVAVSWELFPQWLRVHPGRASAALASFVIACAATYWLFDAPLAPLALRGGTGVEERHEGMRLYEAGRYAEAVQAYQSSLDLRDDPVTRTNLANALKALGRYDDAETQYRAVLSVAPRDGIAWYNLGNLLRRQMKDFRGAKEAYENAIDCAPSFAEAHFNLGAVLLDLQQPEDAAAAIEAALQLASPTAPWRASAEDALTIARAQALQGAPEDSRK